LIGREIRNQVGPAVWLDLILDVLSQLRKSRKTGELLVERPEISRVMPWLENLEPRRYLPTQPARSIPLERVAITQAPDPILNGFQESQLGPGKDLLLADPLDTWAPEARGSSARAFIGFFRTANGQLKQHAVKIMRADRLEYALPLYREEVHILSILYNVPGVIPLLECGFIQLINGTQFPPDNRPLNARALTGNVQRFGPDQTSNFLSSLDARAHQGWLPYIAIPKLDNLENLMWLCDAGYTRGRFLPIEESLRLSLQICDILAVAHERNIVYRDHKLLHYYWQSLYNGIFMIDWNVARYYPGGLSQAEIQFDLVQLGARALHHIFTGRVAPGALADGPNRVEEIETAAQSYRAQWTYDDQRLPPSLKNVLENLLTGGYNRVARLREDLFQVYLQLIEENKPGEPGI
jgi:serine/threonine protein kinase